MTHSFPRLPRRFARAAACLALVAPLVASFAAAPAFASVAETAAPRHFEGAIEIPGSPLAILVDLDSKNGAWSGTIDIPAQGAHALPLADVAVTAEKARFRIPGIPGDPSFDGSFRDGGAKLQGTFTQGGASFPFSLAAAATPAEASSRALAGFAEEAKRVLAAWRAPSAAIAVVVDDKVVFLDAWGYRDVEKKMPATVDTLYAIGSCTKAFTATVTATLVDEGKLDWDKPISEIVPDFRLHDPVATREATLRDLLCHRTGLPRHDLVWYNAKLSREELYQRLRFLEPSEPFRSKWQYNNLMLMTVGRVDERVAGKSWEELVRERIFAPLGFSRSNFSVDASQADGDFAAPYSKIDDKVEKIPFRRIDAMGPAGSINSTARELAQWVRLQLSHGTIDGKKIVSAERLEETHRPQMTLGEQPTDPEIGLESYGFGWSVDSYRGLLRVQHGGAIDGFITRINLYPAKGVGVAVVANLGDAPVPSLLANLAADRVLGLERIDWNARLLARATAAETSAKKGEADAGTERKAGTRPAHPLDDYAGTYEHPAYGAIEIRRSGDTLAATFHDLPIALAHWHYETFRGTPTDKALADLKLFLRFETGNSGDVERLFVPLEPRTADIAFVKRPPARLSDPAFLATLAGRYQSDDEPEEIATISVSGSKLELSIPGQPAYELEPARDVEFRIRGLNGFSVRFVLGKTGKVEEIRFVQPNGVFRSHPKRD